LLLDGFSDDAACDRKVQEIALKLQEVKGKYKLLPVHAMNKGKGKADPLQAWSGPEGSRKLRFPDFMKTAQDGGKVVSITHRPHLPQGNTPGTHFC
jgi:hypothetical protein